MANPAPGFRKVPRGHIATRPAGRRVRVMLGGEVLADSREAVELLEGDYAPVYYLPRKDVRMERLVASPHTTYCPYKGTASHYSMAGGPQDAAWSYAQPYDEMQDIRALVAFYPRKVDAIVISDD